MGSPHRMDRRWRAAELEKTPPDPRTDGQRDRDRILYTDHLRRLSGVTQVAASGEASQFHNRLTHSLEVAQLGRRMAERVISADPDASDIVNADVVEAAALGHDLGHPPFGHCAEMELDKLVKDQGLADGFEGNAQSFRIVTKLATRAEEHPGLDLTRATLQALTKYPWARAAGGKEEKKFGRFHPERADFDWSREGLAAPSRRTAEAEIMDWADDVAYALHDVEDFFRAGLIPLDRLTHPESVEWEEFLTYAFAGIKPPPDEEEDYLRVAADLRQELPPQPWHFSRSRGFFERLIPSRINSFTSALSLVEGIIQVDDDARREVALLKQLTWRYVIEAPALAAQQEGQRNVVRTLYRFYLGAISDPKAVRTLPVNAQAYLANLELTGQHDDEKVTARVACDIVASLSEAQAIALYKRITGVEIGSIFEPINA